MTSCNLFEADRLRPDKPSRWIVLARLLRPQGRKGELLAELSTDFPERFDTHKRVFLAAPGFSSSEANARLAEIQNFWLPTGRNEGRIVLHFKGISSIDQAAALAGLEVLVPETERVELDSEASYISDLIGCTLFDRPGRDPADIMQAIPVGTVRDVQFATTPDGGRRLLDAAPLLEIESLDGEEILVPFAKDFLISIDTPGKRIDMCLPPGLLDVNRS